MGVTYQDVKPRLEARAAKRRAEIAEQAKMAQGIGQTMAELLTDPRWQVYSNHLQAVLESEERRLNCLRDKLTGMTFLNEQETGQTRVDAADARATVRTLKMAIGLAKQLVEEGNKAGEINVS